MQKKLCGAAAVMVVLSMAMFTGVAAAKTPTDWHGNGDRPSEGETGIYDYNQSVVFSEIVVLQETDTTTGQPIDVEYGIDFDGTLFRLGEFRNETWDKDLLASNGPSAVIADWSDDLILHQWKAGQKVRTEVILRVPGVEDTSVYTVRANFTIEHVEDAAGSEVKHVVYSGNTSEGLYVDGPSDAYTAEINQNGNLLYGFNWDTKSVVTEPGFYKLTFTIETDCWVPATFPYTVNEWCGLTIIGVADYDYVVDGSSLATSITHDLLYTSIVIELL